MLLRSLACARARMYACVCVCVRVSMYKDLFIIFLIIRLIIRFNSSLVNFCQTLLRFSTILNTFHLFENV